MNQNNSHKIAIIDIDGSLIDGQIQQGLINFFFKKGQLSLFYILTLNVWFVMYKIHLAHDIRKAFEYGLRYLSNKSTQDISKMIDEYIQQYVRAKIYPRSADLLERLRSDGYSIIILSTAVDAVISKIASLFEVDDYICTKLEIAGGRYTGHIDGNILYGEKKVDALKNYFSEREYSLADAEAYADHESDIPMLKIVGKAYIMNPDTHMKRVAEREGIAIMDVR